MNMIKFSKVITIYCVVMNTLITACVIVLLFLGRLVEAMTVAAMYVPFSIELFFNAMIKMNENKYKGDNHGNHSELGSEADPCGYPVPVCVSDAESESMAD